MTVVKWVVILERYGRMSHAARLLSFVMVVLGSTIHEFADAMRTCPEKLVDGRTKSDHDGVGWR
jgi:hypothetical protein